MTIEETRDILTVLKVNYPQSFRGWGKRQGELFLQLWSTGLKDRSAKEVKTAVWHFIMETDRDFAPNIGQINTWLQTTPSYKVDQLALQFFPETNKKIGSVGPSKEIVGLNRRAGK